MREGRVLKNSRSRVPCIDGSIQGVVDLVLACIDCLCDATEMRLSLPAASTAQYIDSMYHPDMKLNFTQCDQFGCVLNTVVLISEHHLTICSCITMANDEITLL